ncbi:hypothetical protein EUA61_03410 [TM7 phylum sp. oral taxon 346]|nr:hypothetical protein EUA61_03410 [TM7 phylum sp. oral taxon 346]
MGQLNNSKSVKTKLLTTRKALSASLMQSFGKSVKTKLLTGKGLLDQAMTVMAIQMTIKREYIAMTIRTN